MGIYDRDYYRDTEGGWWSRRTGQQATVGLMIACGVAFVAQIFTVPAGGNGKLLLSRVTQWGWFQLQPILDGEVWRLFTSFFLHEDLIPLAVILLFLYYVGTLIEGIYGTREYIAFCLTGALVVSLGKVIVGLVSETRDYPTMGASPLVSASLVLLALRDPNQRFHLMGVIPIPAWVLATAYVGLSVFDLARNPLLGATAYSAHLIAAGFAFAYFKSQVRISVLWDNFTQRFAGRSRSRPPRLSVYRGPSDSELPVPAAAPEPSMNAQDSPRTSARNLDEQLEAKLDQVLEKVSQFGKGSLTPDENDILLRASEIYKRRRGS